METKCSKCGTTENVNFMGMCKQCYEESLGVTAYYEDNFDTSIKFGNYIMAVDRKRNKLCFYYKLELEKTIYFENIIECEIIENSNVIQAGGLGRAIAGGFLAGNTGAIVGATTRKSKNLVSNLSVRIITNEIETPLYTLKIIGYPIDINKFMGANLYKSSVEFANKIYATIQSIINNNGKKNIKQENIKENNTNNYLEQLEKLSSLKEKGIITEEEFLESKRKILSKL